MQDALLKSDARFSPRIEHKECARLSTNAMRMPKVEGRLETITLGELSCHLKDAGRTHSKLVEWDSQMLTKLSRPNGVHRQNTFCQGEVVAEV
jgi:hypothetical protein